MKKAENLKYGNGADNLFDLYLPDNEEFDLIIWFHGGGLEAGSYKYIVFAEDLVKNNIAIASVEYRMYPDAEFPEFIEDAAKSVKFITEEITKYGKPKRIIVAGQSAGAYITLMLAFDKSYLKNARVNRNKIWGYISDSAQTTTHFNVLRERGMDTRLERIDEASPLYYLSEESDFKNLLLIYYENDMPCRAEQNNLFYKSVNRFCNGQNAELRVLPKEHGNGSLYENEHGGYDFVEAVCDFLKV